MAKGDHCSVWGCENDRRFPQRMVKMDHVGKISFYRCQDVKKIRIWKKMIGRTDEVFKRMKGSPCVCSNHFQDGRPTHANPNPTLYLKGYQVSSKKRRLLVRKPIEGRRSNSSDSSRANVLLNHAGQDHNKNVQSTVTEDEEQSECQDDGLIVDEEQCECQDEGLIVDDYVDLGCIKTFPPYEDHDHYTLCDNGCARTRTCSRSTDSPHDMVADLRNTILKLEKELREREKIIIELKEKLTKSFSIDDVKHSDSLVELYTGLQNFQVYKFLLDKIEPKASKLHYYRGKESNTLKSYQSVPGKKKPGKKRTTSISTEFFLTLCRLRQNLSEEDLSYRFKIAASSVSKILSTWIPFLGKEFSSLIQWPKLEEINNFYPAAFKPFPNVCSIIDCTEIYIQRPTLAEAQALTYSTYKSHNTAKYLLSVTPSGVISFVSKGYGGLSSDRFVFNDCSVVEKFERGSSCMVDRGFAVQDLLLPKGVKVFMPPFTKGQKQFTKEKVQEGQAIAKARIHVERAIQRMKRFRIFQSVLPLTLKDSLDNMVLICSALTNLLPPLIANC